LKNNQSFLLKYAGLGLQFLIAIALGIFIGIKLDAWLGFKTPIFVWVLPLLIIVTIIYKIVKDTAPKK
jgi:Na+/glutamate symporter